MTSIAVVKLTDTFFEKNSGLIEALHQGSEGDMASSKQRGYGIVTVRIEGGLLFGIPLRSHISHTNAFKTNGTKGLDYSKAVLIEDESYISEDIFEIPSDEYTSISEKSLYIRERFEKYIKKYIKAANSDDRNILKEYNFSTLQNYHTELKITPPNQTQVSNGHKPKNH